jgi:CxxC-x17-CxxC domain-containing protein
MSQKRMFEVKCTNCGESTTVPFEPKKDRPVYCKTCFSKNRIKQRDVSSVTKRFDMKNAWAIYRNNWQGRKQETQSIFKTP